MKASTETMDRMMDDFYEEKINLSSHRPGDEALIFSAPTEPSENVSYWENYAKEFKKQYGLTERK